MLASHGALAENTPIELKVGGYMEQWVGYANTDSKYIGKDNISDVDVQQDGEIHFTGSTTLDNGLTFGVNVQLEAATEADQIDEAYLFVRGQFGEIVLGSENGAAYAMHYGLGSMGTGLDSGDLSNWIVGTDFALHTTYNFARRDNDSNKIRWISPRFSGVQVGLSWAPEATQDEKSFPEEVSTSRIDPITGAQLNTSNNNLARNSEGIAAAAINYMNQFGEFSVRASLAGQYFTDPNQQKTTTLPASAQVTVDEPYTVGGGLYVGFGNFEVGGSYVFENQVSVTMASRQVGGGSVEYTDGLMGVSLGVTYGKARTLGRDDTQWGVELGGKYILGPGVEARGSLYYADRDEDRTVTQGSTDRKSVV